MQNGVFRVLQDNNVASYSMIQKAKTKRSQRLYELDKERSINNVQDLYTLLIIYNRLSCLRKLSLISQFDKVPTSRKMATCKEHGQNNLLFKSFS